MNPYDPPAEIAGLMSPELRIKRRIGGLLFFAVLNTLVSCWLIGSWLQKDSDQGARSIFVACYVTGCVAIFLWESWKLFRVRS